jgi:hypothetical protein
LDGVKQTRIFDNCGVNICFLQAHRQEPCSHSSKTIIPPFSHCTKDTPKHYTHKDKRTHKDKHIHTHSHTHTLTHTLTHTYTHTHTHTHTHAHTHTRLAGAQEGVGLRHRSGAAGDGAVQGRHPLPSDVCRLASAVCCLLPAVCCLLSAVCCLPSAVCRLLSAVCCLPSAVCCLLPAACCLPSAICGLERLAMERFEVDILCVSDCRTNGVGMACEWFWNGVKIVSNGVMVLKWSQNGVMCVYPVLLLVCAKWPC